MTGTSNSIEVKAVSDKAGLKAFLSLPFRLYADDPHWVPPLYLERLPLLRNQGFSILMEIKCNPIVSLEHGAAFLGFTREESETKGWDSNWGESGRPLSLTK